VSKRFVSLLSAAALLGAATAVTVAAQGPPSSRMAAAGSVRLDKPAPNVKLRDMISGKEIALAQYKGKKPVVAVFISYNCLTTWRYEKRFGEFQQKYGKSVVLLGVHSNTNETDDGIKKYAEARNFGAPILDDKKKNDMAGWVDARSTPTVLVMDKKGVLRYQGSWDDNPDETGVTKTYAVDAVKSVLANKPVSVKTTRAFG